MGATAGCGTTMASQRTPCAEAVRDDLHQAIANTDAPPVPSLIRLMVAYCLGRCERFFQTPADVLKNKEGFVVPSICDEEDSEADSGDHDSASESDEEDASDEGAGQDDEEDASDEGDGQDDDEAEEDTEV